jgi:ABC-type antimicrobial peptide transport system permease subunit
VTDEGIEVPQVFHTATVDTLSPLMMNVRMRTHPAPLIARLPTIASSVDADAYIPEAHALDEWIRQRTSGARVAVMLGAGVTLLTLFLSALGIFSLMSVSVSRRTREIGLRAALGANPRRVLARLLSSAAVLMGSGVGLGGAFLLLQVALMGEDVPRFMMWLAATSAVMLVAGLLACFVPARRALKINPIDALREI